MAHATGPTPHLEGQPGAYAPTVLVPGDPRRATFIAEKYLTDVTKVNAVRGMDGYTGMYNDTPVSVQAVGMGVPSAAIYYTEMIRFYGVQRIVRVGSCGGLSEKVGLGDVIAATAAGTDSAAIDAINEGMNLAAVADFALLRASVEKAEALNVPMVAGPLFTADLFYDGREERFGILQRHGVLGVEMETSCLYARAAAEGISALSLVTVSDDIVRGTAMNSADRENTFDGMMQVALQACEAVLLEAAG